MSKKERYNFKCWRENSGAEIHSDEFLMPENTSQNEQKAENYTPQIKTFTVTLISND
jgi:hypothetical protein